MKKFIVAAVFIAVWCACWKPYTHLLAYLLNIDL